MSPTPPDGRRAGTVLFLRGICQARVELCDVFDVCPVRDDSGDNIEAAVEGDGYLPIFFARMVSIFLVKIFSGISGSARTLS